MRNFIILDYSKQNCHGVVNSAGKCNTVILSLIPATTQLSAYYLEVTDVNKVVHKLSLSNTMTIELNESYFNVSGTIRFRLLSAEGNSAYVDLNCIEFEAGEDVRCSYKDGTFNMCKCIGENTYDLPIATITSLGAVIVGNNLNITPEGVLSAVSEPIEVITTAELEKMLV